MTLPLALETAALGKTFGRTRALDGVDLAVPAGTVFGVIGPNGAGKTTLMRVLLDVIRPSSGEARVLGSDPRTGGPALRRRIGYLPGELRLEGRITGRALLNYYAGISGEVRPGSADRLAERLGLDLDRRVGTLSKGNKQKLGLVQAFLHEPELLVLDEPTSGLDPIVQQEFLALLREARDRGQTVFLSSHVLSEIQQAATDVAVLRAGRVITVSTVDALRQTAIRHVRAELEGVTAEGARRVLTGIPGLSALELSATPSPRLTASFTITGPIDGCVKALAGFTVAELVVEEPDLEESVLRLYHDGETR
ncbi:ABC transporter ATP-binding protein [Galbitalea soli]|uniref:ABC transporter ATP-binding protein n=1 Tax=Galbitalea soli TaxID=1268042 RepID=A0A7C9TU21_9MICO|nr:ABC transporter ATP-binding protein [Galbitalea soli]NEM92203.1 ABC transporter ATP-binding protein [Galbitalea soli]NYJ31843.1 ABC-2 type transport system ATP-binding protein [Galbitalea soli]